MRVRSDFSYEILAFAREYFYFVVLFNGTYFAESSRARRGIVKIQSCCTNHTRVVGALE